MLKLFFYVACGMNMWLMAYGVRLWHERVVFGVWCKRVAWTCDVWCRRVVSLCGLYRVACGIGVLRRRVAYNVWCERVALACGLGVWHGSVYTDVWCIHAAASSVNRLVPLFTLLLSALTHTYTPCHQCVYTHIIMMDVYVRTRIFERFYTCSRLQG